MTGFSLRGGINGRFVRVSYSGGDTGNNEILPTALVSGAPEWKITLFAEDENQAPLNALFTLNGGEVSGSSAEISLPPGSRLSAATNFGDETLSFELLRQNDGSLELISASDLSAIVLDPLDRSASDSSGLNSTSEIVSSSGCGQTSSTMGFLPVFLLATLFLLRRRKEGFL